MARRTKVSQELIHQAILLDSGSKYRININTQTPTGILKPQPLVCFSAAPFAPLYGPLTCSTEADAARNSPASRRNSLIIDYKARLLSQKHQAGYQRVVFQPGGVPTANASGLTPFSMRWTQSGRVVRSSWVF